MSVSDKELKYANYKFIYHPFHDEGLRKLRINLSKHNIKSFYNVEGNVVRGSMQFGKHNRKRMSWIYRNILEDSWRSDELQRRSRSSSDTLKLKPIKDKKELVQFQNAFTLNHDWKWPEEFNNEPELVSNDEPEPEPEPELVPNDEFMTRRRKFHKAFKKPCRTTLFKKSK